MPPPSAFSNVRTLVHGKIGVGRVQDEIEPGFTIDEDGSDEARDAFEREHPDKVQELHDKEAKRRERKQAKAEKNSDGELFEDA